MKAVYIIHPSSFTRTMVFVMSSFTSRKLKKKIFNVINWREMHDFIDPDKFMLPETSRDYITKAYKVTKVNAKGKKQAKTDVTQPRRTCFFIFRTAFSRVQD